MGLVYINASEDVTDAPFRRTVGHEYEYANGSRLARVLADRGHAPSSIYDSYLHSYGCNCDQADDFLIHPTSDCTAGGGEYLIGGNSGVLFGSPIYYEATKALADAALEVRPEVNSHVGGHTHVGTDDLSETDKRRLVRNYLAVQNELEVLMAGSADHARTNGYSQPFLNEQDFIATSGVDDALFWTVDPARLRFFLPSRPTLCFGTSTGHTVEFRGWNSTRAQWRMVVAGNVSAAMVEAAHQGRDAQPGTDLIRHLAGLLRYDVVALIQRQRKSKGITTPLPE